MEFVLSIIGKDGIEKASVSGEDNVCLVYNHEYEEGDSIHVHSGSETDAVLQLEDSIQPTFGFLKNDFTFRIPFFEKRVCYSPKSFILSPHVLTARVATMEEMNRYRNLSLNPLDCHENTGFYPHAMANVETRGEAVFAAHNAINGNYANLGHGPWPYESWGINRKEDAELKIDFGRKVNVDKIGITLRNDFPHDNWWEQATIKFSDGSSFVARLDKVGISQHFSIRPREITWATIGELIKNPDDPSPFPALTQIEFWGN